VPESDVSIFVKLIKLINLELRVITNVIKSDTGQ